MSQGLIIAAGSILSGVAAGLIAALYTRGAAWQKAITAALLGALLVHGFIAAVEWLGR